jgi:hypothetical protein
MGDWGGRWRSGGAYAKWIAIGRSGRISWLCVANNRERFCDILYAIALVGFADAERHAALIAPLREAIPPLVEVVTPIACCALQQMFARSWPWGILGYEKAVHFDQLSDAAVEVILEHQPKKTSALTPMVSAAT